MALLFAVRLYNSATAGFRSQGLRTVRRITMKRAVRMLILMAGLACTYVAIATPILQAELGPMPLCPPKKPNCDGSK
jgi:hypothetical protein